MDPATKRNLWNTLCKMRDNGKCLILTSHNMEECEALCTRLAIMVNGSFKCLGSTQHLKNKFSQGYTLTIKMHKRDTAEDEITEAVERFVKEKFPSAILREKHEELVTFYIPDTSVPWSKMFGIMENEAKVELMMEDYFIGQSSLEQVNTYRSNVCCVFVKLFVVAGLPVVIKNATRVIKLNQSSPSLARR